MKISKKKGFREISCRPCGESSPYWNWVSKWNENRKHPDEVIEPCEGNPDVLPESAHIYTPRLSGRDHDRLDAANMAWGKLSDRERAVLELCGYEGKSIEDASRILRLSRESIKTYIHRASKKIQKELKRIAK